MPERINPVLIFLSLSDVHAAQPVFERVKLANKYGEYVIDAPAGATVQYSKDSNDIKNEKASGNYVLQFMSTDENVIRRALVGDLAGASADYRLRSPNFHPLTDVFQPQGIRGTGGFYYNELFPFDSSVRTVQGPIQQEKEWLPSTMTLGRNSPQEQYLTQRLNQLSLPWDQAKVDDLWEACKEIDKAYGIQVDPRFLLAIIIQEGTGSFNTSIVHAN